VPESDHTLDTVNTLRDPYLGEKSSNSINLSIARSVSNLTGPKISASQKGKVTDWLSDHSPLCGPRNMRAVAFPSKVLLAALIIVSLIVYLK
jgi:hypothetical protein